LAWLAVAFLVLIAGCAPKIGDHCSVSTDCSVSGDRLCDITQPSGYCTTFNCEPNGCPDEAVCVAFTETSCSSPAVSTRFQRTFCMAFCEDDGDCRTGYKCIDTSNDPGRQVVDSAPSSRRICTVASSSPPMPAADADPPVCGTPDASFPAPDAEAGTDAAASDAAEAGPDAEPTSPDAPPDAAE